MVEVSVLCDGNYLTRHHQSAELSVPIIVCHPLILIPSLPSAISKVHQNIFKNCCNIIEDLLGLEYFKINSYTFEIIFKKCELINQMLILIS